MDLRKTALLVTISLFFVSNGSIAQNVDFSDPLANNANAASIMFFGRQPSARVEAMGKNFMAADGSISSAFYNPAAISFNKGVSFSYSNSGPYYAFVDASFNFVGGTIGLGNFGAIGFSFYQYIPHYESIDFGFPDIRRIVKLYTVNYATELIPMLYLGININFFTEWNAEIFVGGDLSLGRNVKHKGIFPDIGIVKSFNFSRANVEHLINIGSSLFNVSKADLKETSNGTHVGDKNLPVTLRIGASYESSLNKITGHYKLKALSWFIAAEYQEILNSKYRNGFKFGGEITGFEILKLRLGYYREKLPFSDNCGNCKKHLTDFTYGAGIFLPFSLLSDNTVPIDFSIDFIKKDHAEFATGVGSLFDDFTVLSFTANWKF